MSSPFAPPSPSQGSPDQPYPPEQPSWPTPPAGVAAPGGPYGAPNMLPAVNPGKSGSVAAFVFSFLCWPAGLVLGIVSIAKSRRAGAPALGLSIAAVVISGLSAVLGIIVVAAALGSGGSVDAADTGTPAAVPAAPTPQSADTEVPADAATVTCDSIIPDIVSVTPSNPLTPQLLAIYEAETVANHVDAYTAGEFEVPDGQTEVKVIECTGLGSFNDGSQERIAYYESVDVNDEVFIGYNLVEAGQ